MCAQALQGDNAKHLYGVQPMLQSATREGSWGVPMCEERAEPVAGNVSAYLAVGDVNSAHVGQRVTIRARLHSTRQTSATV